MAWVKAREDSVTFAKVSQEPHQTVPGVSLFSVDEAMHFTPAPPAASADIERDRVVAGAWYERGAIVRALPAAKASLRLRATLARRRTQCGRAATGEDGGGKIEDGENTQLPAFCTRPRNPRKNERGGWTAVQRFPSPRGAFVEEACHA